MPRPIYQIEIRVSDLSRSVAFYRAIFDWDITPVADNYAMGDTGRLPIVSLWAVGDSGMPLGVCHYVASDDCEADAAHAVALGGQVVVERTEVEAAGAWTDTLDPWRNELAFWQATTPAVPALRGHGSNHFGWVEIGAANRAQAAEYYAKLVDWQFEAVPAVADYAICTANAPGIGLVGGERGAKLGGMTPYIATPDMAASCAAIAAAHGEVLGEPMDLGDGSTFTLFTDPDANRFGLVARKVG